MIFCCQQYAGLQLREVRNLSDGTLDMAELREKLRPSNPVDFESYTSLVCVENTQNYLGGVVLPLEWLDQVTNIRVRLDFYRFRCLRGNFFNGFLNATRITIATDIYNHRLKVDIF